MDQTNLIDCYLYYMWNAWGEEDCMELFGTSLGEHIWAIWIGLCRSCGRTGAAACLYAELDPDKRRMLADRAFHYYNDIR